VTAANVEAGVGAGAGAGAGAQSAQKTAAAGVAAGLEASQDAAGAPLDHAAGPEAGPEIPNQTREVAPLVPRRTQAVKTETKEALGLRRDHAAVLPQQRNK